LLPVSKGRRNHDPAGLTTILPVIYGWIEQKYSYSPGAVKVSENLSSVSSAADLNFPSFSRTECGLSSSFVQVTLVPEATPCMGGELWKLSIWTAAECAASAEGARGPAATRAAVAPRAPSNNAGFAIIVQPPHAPSGVSTSASGLLPDT